MRVLASLGLLAAAVAAVTVWAASLLLVAPEPGPACWLWVSPLEELVFVPDPVCSARGFVPPVSMRGGTVVLPE